MDDFSGQVVLVTGGSKGIGRSTVQKFCERGARCVVVSRHVDECEAYVCELTSAGWNAEAEAADIGKIADIKRMVASVVARNGKIDVLVNSAAVNIRKQAIDYTEDDWDHIEGINLKGLFFCCTEVGKVMLAQGHGAVVNIASLQSHIVLKERCIYAATKGGVCQITKGLANEWAKGGIRVNSISPGFVETPMVRPVLDSPYWRNLIDSRTPMGRSGKPEEIADLIMFLASSSAAYITGTDVAIDGGWLAS